MKSSINSYFKVFIQIFVFVGIAFFSDRAFSSQLSCQNLFTSEATVSKPELPDSITRINLDQIPKTKDYLEFLSAHQTLTFSERDENFSKYHSMVLELSEKKASKSEITEIQKIISNRLKNKIKHALLEAQNQYDRSRINIQIEISQLRRALDALQLLKYDKQQWENFINSEADRVARENGTSEYGFNTTAGYVIRKLDDKTKLELLKFIGQKYSDKKNGELLSLVHVILEPKKIYSKMISEGKNPLDFYRYYFNMVQQLVFSEQSRGQYSFDHLANLMKEIQKHAYKDVTPWFNDDSPIYVFGSVPNGYAKSGSDIDLFHEGFIYHSESLEKGIQPFLSSNSLNWQLEQDPGRQKYASEDFSSERNVFSFFIYPKKIQVKFYLERLIVDESGSPINTRSSVIVDIP